MYNKFLEIHKYDLCRELSIIRRDMVAGPVMARVSNPMGLD